jgi:hypothetical protein
MDEGCEKRRLLMRVLAIATAGASAAQRACETAVREGRDLAPYDFALEEAHRWELYALEQLVRHERAQAGRLDRAS